MTQDGSNPVSLACPSSAIRTDLEHLVPAFPDVDVRWDAVCLPHLRLIGMRRDLRQPDAFRVLSEAMEAATGAGATLIGPEMRHTLGPRIREAFDAKPGWQLTAISAWHEAYGHYSLRLAPLIRARDVLVHELWSSIYSLCLADPQTTDSTQAAKLAVPLGDGRPENRLVRLWHLIKELHEKSSRVEETFSVWASLNLAMDVGMFTKEEAEDRLFDYLLAYDFRDLYDDFAPVAHAIGYPAAASMTQTALGTLDPEPALRHLIALAKLQLPRGQPSSRDELHQLVLAINQNFDSAYYSQNTSPLAAIRPLIWSIEAAMLSEGERGAWAGEEWHLTGSLQGTFDANGLFARLPTDRTHMVFVESLRQQLVHGRGLRCPFWYEGEPCCGRRFLLERLWGSVEPNAGAPWRLDGCLKS